MQTKSRFSGISALVVAAAAFLAAPVSAATVPELFFQGFQLWSDNSADKLYNFAGGATTVDVGDVLISTFDVGTAEQLGTTRNFGIAGNNEFSGLLALEVATKAGAPGLFTYTFVPVSAANRAAIAATAPLHLGPALTAMSATAMAVFFDDPTPDYTRTGAGTVDDLTGTAVDGSKLFEFGFLGLPGEGWSAFSFSDDITVVGATPAPGIGGGVNFALNLIPGTNMSGVEFNRTVPSFFGGTVDLNGSGSLLGTGVAATPFDAFDDFNATVNVNLIPEPSSVAIWSVFGLVAGAYSLRRRQRRA